ncbi:MAG TPA: branched-chain amino acid ABC transporter permease [Chloroflexia bacterium]|nr:branched-chain amino acid ABC transporter permease [Chloroflexia bacterium]
MITGTGERPAATSPEKIASAGKKALSARATWLQRAARIIFGLLLVLFPFFTDKQWLSVGTFGLIISIGALSLNVLSGYTGLASLGHAFFLGVGAYTCVYFGLNLGWSFLLWLPLAGVVSGLVGLMIGVITLRFRGFYLSIVTLGLVFIGEYIFTNWKEVTGGVNGRRTPSPALGDFSWAHSSTFGPLELNRDQKYYFLALLLTVLVILFVRNVLRTHTGRAFQAVRDREVAAALMGINVARTRIVAFVFSTVLAGICGALYASYLSYIQPNQWDLNFSIQFIAMIIIGGAATVNGSIIGAFFIVAIPQLIDNYIDLLPFVQKGAGTGGITTSDFKEIIYAILLGIFLIFEPAGLIGIYRRLKARVMRSELGRFFR